MSVQSAAALSPFPPIADQRQNDVFGAVLDSILLHTQRSKRLPRRLWPTVQSVSRASSASDASV